jgi:hypothetical protein
MQNVSKLGFLLCIALACRLSSAALRLPQPLATGSQSNRRHSVSMSPAGLRSTEQVRLYFQKYRAARKVSALRHRNSRLHQRARASNRHAAA